MEKSILQSRLLQSAKCLDSAQMPEDYSAQFEEFKTLARSVLYSDAGFNAIEETLDEVLIILKESLKRKKKCCAALLPQAG